MSEARQKYADIIDREHHVSAKRPPMDRLSRAAQFSPFAALTGYEDLIRESERETDERWELDENSKELLNRKLIRLLERLPSPEASFVCFVPDAKKEGGEYVTVSGSVVKCDESAGTLTLDSGRVISVGSVIRVDSDRFNAEEW